MTFHEELDQQPRSAARCGLRRRPRRVGRQRRLQGAGRRRAAHQSRAGRDGSRAAATIQPFPVVELQIQPEEGERDDVAARPEVCHRPEHGSWNGSVRIEAVSRRPTRDSKGDKREQRAADAGLDIDGVQRTRKRGKDSGERARN